MSDVEMGRNGGSQDTIVAQLEDKPAPAPPSFPEGGLTAWLTVAGGSMVIFSTFGAIQAFGVFQDYYTRISLTDRTPSEISWIGSVQIFFLFAMGIPAGKLFDQGYFRHLMFGGSFVYLFSFFMLSLTKPHQYYQIFLSQGVGLGIGMGLMFLPALSVASHYFRARRSVAMGFISAGSSLGGIVYPIFYNNLFHGKAGFAWGVRGAAFLVLGLLLIANLIMKTRLPSRKERQVDAESIPSVRKIATDVPYLVCVVGASIVFWGAFFPFFYLQLFAVEHGVNEKLAFYSITSMNAASLFGRTIPNFLADSIGPLNVMIPTCVGAGVLIFALLGTNTAAGVIVFAVLYGFFSGAALSLITPVLANFSTSVNEVGLRIGIAMFIMAFFILTGAPIDGALLHAPDYVWHRPIIFSGVVVIAGTGLLALSRSMLAKRKGTWKV